MSEFLVDEMRKALRNAAARPLVICGAGVSMQATNGKAPSWSALIETGISRVEAIDAGANAWASKCREALRGGNGREWIDIADEVTDRLGGQGHIEFSEWISNNVGNLEATRHELLRAIGEMNCPIATTNYDSILSDFLGSRPVLWSDHADCMDILLGKKSGIIHLHGHWETPDSVILGSRSYEKHSADHRRRQLQEFAALGRPTIFIGCSADGVSDPDFSQLDLFLDDWHDVAQRRFWLVRQPDGADGDSNLPKADLKRHLYPVGIGPTHDDLLHSFAALLQAACITACSALSKRNRNQIYSAEIRNSSTSCRRYLRDEG